jgi:hypothetical protein
MRTPLAVSLATAAFALALDATAAPIRRVALVVVPPSEKLEREALGLQAEVAALLARDPRLEVADLAARSAPLATEQSARQLAALQQVVEDVEAKVSRLQLQEARAAAEQGLQTLPGQDLRVLRELTLRLLVQTARIKRTLKLDDQGAAELSQALALDPERAPPRGLNTSERTWFAAARKAAAEAHPVTVNIASAGGSGWVWFDGKPVGLTPVVVPKVIPGRHFVTFASPIAEPEHRSEVLGVAADALGFTVRASPQGRDLRALLASLAAGLARGEPSAFAEQLQAWAGSDEVVAVSLLPSGKAKVFRSAGASTLLAPAFEATGAEAVAAEVLRALGEPLVAPLSPAVAAMVAARAQGEAGRRTVLWGVTIAGASAGAVGAGLLVTGLKVNDQLGTDLLLPDGSSGIPTVAQAQQRRSTARGLEVAGAVLGGIGVVAGIVGGVWLLSTPPPAAGATSLTVALSVSPGMLVLGGAF